MRLFIDTEFTDFAPMRQQLISLGVISECGLHKFYVEISDYRKDYASDFVKGVVWPLLEHGYHSMQYVHAAEEYSKWLDRLPVGHLQFIIDYPADFALMAPLMKFTKRSYGVQMFNIELVQALKDLGITDEHKIDDAMRAVIYSEDNYFKIDPRQHHSLVDAHESRHAFLRGIRAAS